MKRMLYIFSILTIFLLSSPYITAQNIRQTEMIATDYATIELTITTDSVRIQNAKPGSVMEIYNILGVKVNSIPIDSTDTTVPLTLPKGYYIFKLDTVVRKVIIK